MALLKAGTNVNCRGELKKSPLHHAAEKNSLEVAQVLLAHGADVNARGQAEWTPLHQAVENNRLEVAQVLLAHGADVNAPSSLFPRRVDGKTPVARAKYWEYREMEALLRQHGGH